MGLSGSPGRRLEGQRTLAQIPRAEEPLLKKGKCPGPLLSFASHLLPQPSFLLQTLKSSWDWNFPLTRLFAEKVVVYFPALYH